MNMDRYKRFAIAIILAVMITGCSATNTGDEAANNQGTIDTPTTEQPVVSEEESTVTQSNTDSTDTNIDSESAETDVAVEDAVEPAEVALGSLIPLADLTMSQGDIIRITTMIEGMEEEVDVTQYRLEPFGISYVMRTDMGEPNVEAKQITYATQIGDDVASVSLYVIADMSLDEVAGAMKDWFDQHQVNITAPVQDIVNEATSYPGKLQYGQKSLAFVGYEAYQIDDVVLLTLNRYPFEAADGMSAVIHELVSSLGK
jgi:hypothetical protein